MGKMKLTKKNTRSATKGKSGIPNWLLSTIIAVVVIAVLLTCVATLLSSTGAIGRMSTAMKAEDYKVNGNMMLYFYANTYNNFASTYSSYLKYLSLGEGTPIDEHHNIVIGADSKTSSYDNALFSSYSGKTWFEYFMAQTEDSVKSMLVYCEAADELGIKLTEEDEKTIEDAIDSVIDEYRAYNLLNGGGELSEATCLRMMYGSGINRSDIRNAMKLSTLASKCSEKMYDDVEAAVTADRISKEYDDNKLDYNLVDYFYYGFSVKYDDVAEQELGEDYTESELEANKDKVLAAYKAKIEEQRAIANELKALTDISAFKNYVLNYAADSAYDDLFEEEGLKSEVLPAEDAQKTIKEKMIAAVIAEVVAGEEDAKDDVVTTKGEGEAADTYTIYEISITKDFAEAAKTIKEDLFTNLSSLLDSYSIKKDTYTKDDDFSEWAFADGRKDGDITILEEGDGTKEGEFKAEDKSFRATVYFLEKAQRKDEDKARDVAYMLFTSTDTAKKALEKVKAVEGLNKDKFAQIGTEMGASVNTVIEDYMEGEMQSSSFDSWLYDEKTTVGTYSDSVITMSDGSTMVAFYVGEGDACWSVTVKNALIEEDYTAKEDKIIAEHSGKITKNDWVLGRIGK